MTRQTLREALLADYHTGHAAVASGPMYADVRAAWPYYEANYGALLRTLPKSASILEIGPGHGSLLAWLRSLGFERIEGVDASPGDVAFANIHLHDVIVQLGDAHDFLLQRPARYDLVIAKAVIEHVPRTELLPLIDAIFAALRPSGTALIDVPNMDWILATHERYMDLTHEIGFTRDSLTALLMLRFERVEVHGSTIPQPTRSQRLFRRPLISLLRRLLYVLGEGASETLFESRSIIATATRSR
jgi:2-polyprenyl-3-methyl-5-hydroxy-6-metoxy-1,4-benzoquinol methylase